MKNNRCIINELAKTISEDKTLKAVRLDTTHKKVSIAFEKGKETALSRNKVESILAHYKPEEESQCINDVWKELDCQLCDKGIKQVLPENIRLVSFAKSGVLIEKVDSLTPRCLWRWEQSSLVLLRPRQFTLPADLTNLTEWKQQLALSISCGIFALFGFVLENFILNIPHSISIGFFLIAYVSGAYFPFKETFELLRKGILDVHFLMLCVALGAAFIGHWWEGAALLFLFSLSGALEEMAMANTEREIKSLFKEAPKTAHVIQSDGKEEIVNIEDLKVGMNLRVRPGEQFPVDSIVVEGTSAANEASLTGESLPVDKKPGDTVFSGTMNTWGSIECRVLKLASESVLAKIIHLIEQAQESKAPSQRFTDKFSTGYTYGILSLSVLMFFFWWLGMHIPPFIAPEGETSAFYRAMTLLVVASPCALVLSIPSAILAGIASGAKKGVLFRGGVAIEKLAEVTRVALDKTGTLTTGDLKIVKVNTFPESSQEIFLKIVASLSNHSTHPVSKAIKKAYLDKGGKLADVEAFESLSGQGLEGIVVLNETNQRVKTRLGRRSMFNNQEWLKKFSLPEIGITEVIIETEQVRGQILLLDSVREASAPLFKELASKGIRVSMLTGDTPQAANLIAKQVGITEVYASLHPEQKVKLIQDWEKAGEKVAMVGDGVNDAASLAASYVGVGMGMRGSDAVLEQADIVLMQDKLENFIFAFNLSKKARRIIQQNLIISLGVIIVLVLSALGSIIPLTVGVIGHEGSTVIVVLNSLRLLMNSSKNN